MIKKMNRFCNYYILSLLTVSCYSPAQRISDVVHVGVPTYNCVNRDSIHSAYQDTHNILAVNQVRQHECHKTECASHKTIDELVAPKQCAFEIIRGAPPKVAQNVICQPKVQALHYLEHSYNEDGTTRPEILDLFIISVKRQLQECTEYAETYQDNRSRLQNSVSSLEYIVLARKCFVDNFSPADYCSDIIDANYRWCNNMRLLANGIVFKNEVEKRAWFRLLDSLLDNIMKMVAKCDKLDAQIYLLTHRRSQLTRAIANHKAVEE